MPEKIPFHSSIHEFELDFLKQEYFFLQNTVEDYNKQIWVIKALGITGTGAVIALTLQQKQGLISLLGCSIPVFFWILESQWKHFQRGFYPRISRIERDMCERGLTCPQIFTEWSNCLKRPAVAKSAGYFQDGLFNPSVFISYLLEIMFLILLSFIKFP